MHGTLTRRQIVTAAALLYSDRRVRPTHAELAKRFGVSRSAITRRLSRFTEILAGEQQARFAQCLGRRGRKVRFTPVQLSLVGPC